MNWFERYGIAGAYFVTLTAAWLYAFTSGETFWADLWYKGNITYIAVIGGALFLPAGYIISIFSQYMYYRSSIFPQIHKNSIKEGNLKQFSRLINETEDVIEADMSVLYRLTHEKYTKDKEILGRFKYLHQFLTKRWDVLAINQILMVSTFLAIIIPLITLPFFNLDYLPHRNLPWFLAIISLLILLALCLNQRVLSEQLDRTYKQLHKYFEPIKINNKTSNNSILKGKIPTFLILITIIAGTAFFFIRFYWLSFLCLVLLIIIYKIDSLYELGVWNFTAKFNKLIRVLLLEKRHVEQLDVMVEGEVAYVDLEKEPVPNLIDIFCDNLYLRPETYIIDGRRITFDTKEEQGILAGGKITVTYYDKDTIKDFLQ